MVTFESEEWCAVQRELLVESFLREQVAFNLFFAPLLMASSFPVTMFKGLSPAQLPAKRFCISDHHQRGGLTIFYLWAGPPKTPEKYVCQPQFLFSSI